MAKIDQLNLSYKLLVKIIKWEWVEMFLPESSLIRVKSSGSPPMNTPVFSPIMVLPVDADALPGGEDGGDVTHKCSGARKSAE